MSDRSSARAWGKVFRTLAENLPRAASQSTVLKVAFDLWCSEEFQRADFTPDQMCADEALDELGLASRNQPVAALVDGAYHYAESNGEIKT